MRQDQDAFVVLRMLCNLLANIGARPIKRQSFSGCGCWSGRGHALRARAPGGVGRGWWNARSITQGSWEALIIVGEQRCIINVLLKTIRAMLKTNIVQIDLGMRFGQISTAEWQPEHAHLQARL